MVSPAVTFKGERIAASALYERAKAEAARVRKERGIAECAPQARGLVHSETSGQRPLKKTIAVLGPQERREARVARMRKTVLNAARLLTHQRGGFRSRWWFVTLTYRPGWRWEARQITEFCRALRLWAKQRGFRAEYVWTMELHKSGVPHYHVIVRLPGAKKLPKPDVFGWWPHGMSNRKEATNPVGYIAKYASKGDSYGEFPKGARIHGNGGLQEDGRAEVAWWNLPTWVRESEAFAHFVKDSGKFQRARRVKGGFVIRGTGEFLPTPYRVVFMGGVCLVQRIKD